MSVEALIKMTSSTTAAITDTQAIRDRIFEEFYAAPSSEHRCALLAMFKATMDLAENHVAKNGDEQELVAFREARVEDYTKLLVTESTVNGTFDGTVSPEILWP